MYYAFINIVSHDTSYHFYEMHYINVHFFNLIAWCRRRSVSLWQIEEESYKISYKLIVKDRGAMLNVYGHRAFEGLMKEACQGALKIDCHEASQLGWHLWESSSSSSSRMIITITSQWEALSNSNGQGDLPLKKIPTIMLARGFYKHEK